MVHDYLSCHGNICAADPDKELRNWWPSEKVCSNKPYAKWQKVQVKINKLVSQRKLKRLDTYYFLKELEEIGRVTASTIGILSNKSLDRVVAKKEANNTPVSKQQPLRRYNDSLRHLQQANPAVVGLLRSI